MEINVRDYISDEDMREIVEDEVRRAVSAELYEQRMHDWLESTLSNVAYMVVWQEVDKLMDGDPKQMIAEKIPHVIEGLSPYSVFRKKGEFNREDSIGQTILDQAVTDNADLIDSKVKEIIGGLDKRSVRLMVEDAVRDAVVAWMDGDE